MPSSATRTARACVARDDALLREHHEMRIVDRASAARGTAPWHPRSSRSARTRRIQVRTACAILSQAEKIGQQPVGAVGAGGQLAPQAEPEINPASLAVARFDQRAGLRPRVQRKRIGRTDEVDVARVALGEEVGAALLYPTGPVLRADVFGMLNTGCVGTSTSTGAFSSVTRSVPTFAG